jgi:hypothetical protein
MPADNESHLTGQKNLASAMKCRERQNLKVVLSCTATSEVGSVGYRMIPIPPRGAYKQNTIKPGYWFLLRSQSKSYRCLHPPSFHAVEILPEKELLWPKLLGVKPIIFQIKRQGERSLVPNSLCLSSGMHLDALDWTQESY